MRPRATTSSVSALFGQAAHDEFSARPTPQQIGMCHQARIVLSQARRTRQRALKSNVFWLSPVVQHTATQWTDGLACIASQPLHASSHSPHRSLSCSSPRQLIVGAFAYRPGRSAGRNWRSKSLHTWESSADRDRPALCSCTSREGWVVSTTSLIATSEPGLAAGQSRINNAALTILRAWINTPRPTLMVAYTSPSSGASACRTLERSLLYRAPAHHGHALQWTNKHRWR